MNSYDHKFQQTVRAVHTVLMYLIHGAIVKIHPSNYLVYVVQKYFFILLEPFKLVLFDKNGFLIFSHKIMFESILKLQTFLREGREWHFKRYT